MKLSSKTPALIFFHKNLFLLVVLVEVEKAHSYALSMEIYRSKVALWKYAEWKCLKPAKKNIENLRRHLGIIFQDYKLIKDFNVEKNVMLPMIIGGFTKESCKAQTDRLLAHIKLSHKGNKYPLELSGGEQQRVAMARALSHNPLLILADEPTGNLDDYSSEVIWSLLKGVNEQLGITIVVVTHRIPETFGIKYRHLHIEEGVIYELS